MHETGEGRSCSSNDVTSTETEYSCLPTVCIVKELTFISDSTEEGLVKHPLHAVLSPPSLGHVVQSAETYTELHSAPAPQTPTSPIRRTL